MFEFALIEFADVVYDLSHLVELVVDVQILRRLWHVDHTEKEAHERKGKTKQLHVQPIGVHELVVETYYEYRRIVTLSEDGDVNILYILRKKLQNEVESCHSFTWPRHA